VNARLAAALLVLLAALGGGALIAYRQSQAPQPAGALGQPLLKGLKAADVAAISIRQPKESLELRLKDGRWTIAERADFAADPAKVKEFAVKLIELRIGEADPLGEKDRARLHLDDSGARVDFRGADGKILAALVIGKKYFKREPDNPERAIADGRWAMRAGEPGTAFLVADPLSQASAKSADWIAKTAFSVERVKTLEVRPPSGEGWRIERKGDNADWKLTPLKAGEKLDVTRANSASYSLSLLELADVAPQDASPAATGLDKPTLVNATTLDGLSYAIKVGKLEGANYYVSFSPGDSLIKTRSLEKNEKAADKERRDKEFAERVKRIAERLPAEKQLSNYVLLIPKSKLEDTLKKRGELLEKKEPKKK